MAYNNDIIIHSGKNPHGYFSKQTIGRGGRTCMLFESILVAVCDFCFFKLRYPNIFDSSY